MKNTIIFIFLIIFYAKSYSQTKNKELEKIDILIKNREYNTSLNLITELIAKDSLNYEYYLKKGEVNELIKNFQEANNSYNIALELNPNSSKVYEKISFFHYKLNYYDIAIKECDSGLALKNLDSNSKNYLLFTKAESLFMKKNYTAAIDNYKNILNNNPIESIESLSYLSIAKTFVKLNQNDEAIFYLENCIKKYPDLILAINNLAFRYNVKGNYSKSIMLFEKALNLSLKLKTNDDGNINFSDKLIGLEGTDKITIALILNNISFAKHKLKRNEEALIDVNKSIELYSENSYAYRNLALIYIDLNKLDKACEAIEKSLKLGFEKQFGSEISELENKYCK